MSGGAGSADAKTSMNQVAELRRSGLNPRRRGHREWIWFALALLPLVVVSLVAIPSVARRRSALRLAGPPVGSSAAGE